MKIWVAEWLPCWLLCPFDTFFSIGMNFRIINKCGGYAVSHLIYKFLLFSSEVIGFTFSRTKRPIDWIWTGALFGLCVGLSLGFLISTSSLICADSLVSTSSLVCASSLTWLHSSLSILILFRLQLSGSCRIRIISSVVFSKHIELVTTSDSLADFFPSIGLNLIINIDKIWSLLNSSWWTQIAQ